VSSVTARLRILALAAAVGLTAACNVTAPSNVRFNTYTVSGESLGALNRELALHGPQIPGRGRALASADINFKPNVLLEYRGGECRVATAEFRVDAEVTLPEWRQKDRASPELAAVWEAFSAEALEHELTHVRIAEEHARAMERAVRRLSAGGCPTVEAEIRRTIDRIAPEHSAAQTHFHRGHAVGSAGTARAARVR
jgi:predicted secreted Zn-dependent protease